MIMFEQIQAKAQKQPYALALSVNNQHINYATLIKRIEKAKAMCITQGIRPHDKVALMLPNIIENVVLFYALNQLKATIIMMHPLGSSDTLKQQIELMKPSKVFVLDALAANYTAIIDTKQMVVVSIAPSYGGFKRIAAMMRYGLSYPSNRWEKTKPSHDDVDTTAPNKDAVILFTSGTTGNQKAISLSNEAFMALAEQLKEVIVFEKKDAMYCVLPFFHGFGLGVTMHTVLAIGGRCVLIPRLEKQTLISQLLKEKPSYIAGVPYLYRLLLQSPEFKQADLSFIKGAYVGGELVSAHLLEAFNKLLLENNSLASLQVGYGMSECVTVVTLSDPLDTTPNRVGKPLSKNDVLIINKDNTPAKPFEMGEIWVSGPTMMNGYYQRDDLTNQAITSFLNKPYYHSNDVGYMDEAGYVYFSHRMDDLIKINGYFVNPNKIEQAISSIENCVENKVFVNQEGQLCAMMVLSEATLLSILQEKTTQALKDLDRWHQPKHYYVVDALPKNDMRKISLDKIKQSFTDHAMIQFLQEWSL